jgi:extracellular factor (EF) 3-hydroxypalmitic acid methyl ester biosynthesis protein
VNAFFLHTPPVVAHRNRIDTLVKRLDAETLRVRRQGRRTKIFNLGCGPAVEIQRFLQDSLWSDMTDFTLMDFNDETVAYASQTLGRVRDKNGRRSTLTVLKKSVAQLVANSSKFSPASFDLVYCAGLFDYLPDALCTRLLDFFYHIVAPGGLVLVSNVDACNPMRKSMELIMEWFLIYRDAIQIAELIPKVIGKENVRVFSEPSSVNIFAEIRKPLHA